MTEIKELRKEIEDLRESIKTLNSGLKNMGQGIIALTNLLAELLDSLETEALLENPPTGGAPEMGDGGPAMHN